MPGVCKNETPSPKPQLLGRASMPSNASLTSTQSESSQNSQDAQNPWAIHPQRLFQSPSVKSKSPGSSTPQALPRTPATATKAKSTAAAATPAAPGQPKAKNFASPPPVSAAAVNKRLSRAMEPTSKGVYRVAESIRQQWQAGGTSKDKVIRLFASVGFDTDRHALKPHKP